MRCSNKLKTKANRTKVNLRSHVGKGRKRCPDCRSIVSPSMGFCVDCGFDFVAYRHELMGEKLKKRIFRTYNSILNRASKTSGGKKRGIKGKGFEKLFALIVEYTWLYRIGQPADRLTFMDSCLYSSYDSLKELRSKDYYKLASRQEKELMRNSVDKMRTRLDTDIKVEIDGLLVLFIEAKCYCEMAMLKRVHSSFMLAKNKYPELSCYLFELENGLGGDFSILNDKRPGSTPVHCFLSEMYDLTGGNTALESKNIMSILDGVRRSETPIHDPVYRKNFTEEVFDKMVDILEKELKKHV